MEILGHKGSKAAFLTGKEVKYRIDHLPKKSEIMPWHLVRITVLNVSGNTEVGFQLEVIQMEPKKSHTQRQTSKHSSMFTLLNEKKYMSLKSKKNLNETREQGCDSSHLTLNDYSVNMQSTTRHSYFH